MLDLQDLDHRIGRHDLLSHPFYQAWESGQLTREDLRFYAAGYFPHVAAFPTYLSRLHARMPDGPLRRTLVRNLCGEEIQGRAHSELWLDFAEDVGADRTSVREQAPMPAVRRLIDGFEGHARAGAIAEAWAAFYAYESQVPRISRTKIRGLRDQYGLSPRGYAYFTVHATADIHHARAWRQGLEAMAADDSAVVEPLCRAAEETAQALWGVLDAMEERRVGAAKNPQ